ncbi:MAG: EamA family transporter [Candidatus Moranbacteria bacterium]|nr:EamA family transporter [Candidatus Moranbacteria bacterium]
MNWIVLSLIAPLFWALTSFVDKYVLGKYSRGLADFVFFSSLGSWLLFFALMPFSGMPVLSLRLLIPVATGMMLMYSYWLYGKALGEGDVSTTIILLYKLIPVVTAALAFAFLGESLAPKELLGFVIVLAGATAVSFERGGKLLVPGLPAIFGVVVLWSVMTLLIDYGLEEIPFWQYLMLDSLGSAVAGLSLFLVPSLRREMVAGIRSAGGGKYAWYVGNNLLDFVGQMSVKKAVMLAPAVSLVTLVIQVQSFYGIVIGALLTVVVPQVIREDISPRSLVRKVIGAAVMFSGIVLLVG